MIGPLKTQETTQEVILETETRIGPFKTQETTPEVILEGNTPRIIKTSLPTNLKINNIIQETYQEVTPEEETQTLKIGHIVEVEIKDINLGHTHTQLGTMIDQGKDMKIHMDKGTNHKKETLHILGKEIIAKVETTEKEKETHLNQEATTITGPQTIQQKKGTPHIPEEGALPETGTTTGLLHQ